MRPSLSTLFPVGLLLLTGCDAPYSAPSFSPTAEVTRLVPDLPPGAPEDSCWAKRTTPAIYETVTEQIMLQPAEVMADGTVVSPAVFKSETSQAVVRERKETWFEVPCPRLMTVEFLASLQRALKARGHFRGPITAELSPRTQEAIRRYQKPQGLDSGILSLAAARQLGLIAVDRTQLQ